MKIRTYLKKYHPEIYKQILGQTKLEASRMFALYPECREVKVPFILPLNAKFDTPTASFIKYDRNLNEVKNE